MPAGRSRVGKIRQRLRDSQRADPKGNPVGSGRTKAVPYSQVQGPQTELLIIREILGKLLRCAWRLIAKEGDDRPRAHVKPIRRTLLHRQQPLPLGPSSPACLWLGGRSDAWVRQKSDKRRPAACLRSTPPNLLGDVAREVRRNVHPSGRAHHYLLPTNHGSLDRKTKRWGHDPRTLLLRLLQRDRTVAGIHRLHYHPNHPWKLGHGALELLRDVWDLLHAADDCPQHEEKEVLGLQWECGALGGLGVRGVKVPPRQSQQDPLTQVRALVGLRLVVVTLQVGLVKRLNPQAKGRRVVIVLVVIRVIKAVKRGGLT